MYKYVLYLYIYQAKTQVVNCGGALTVASKPLESWL